MRRALVILLLASGCDRLFALEHVEPTNAGPADASDSGALGCGVAMHDFCDNFDRAPPVELPWDKLMASGSTTLELSETASVSMPSSLQVNLPDNAALGYLVEQLPAPITALRLQTDVAVETTDTSGEVDLIALVWQQPPPPCSLLAFILMTRGNPRSLTMQETYLGCGTGDEFVYTHITTLAPGFHHITISVALGPEPALQVNLGEQPRASRLIPVALTQSPVLLHVGASFIAFQSTPWTLRFDDVIADVE